MQLSINQLNKLSKLTNSIDKLTKTIDTFKLTLDQPINLLEEARINGTCLKLNEFILTTIKGNLAEIKQRNASHKAIFPSVVRFIANNQKITKHALLKLLREKELVINTYSVRIGKKVYKVHIVNTDNLNKAIDELKQ